MRTKNSYAAAVAAAIAAVVFSAVFQPASAGIVTIDSFGGSSSDTASSSALGNNVLLLNLPQPISDAFNRRRVTSFFEQDLFFGDDDTYTAAVFSGTAVVSSGIGTFTFSKAALTSGSSYPYMSVRSAVQWTNTPTSPVNLLGDGVGGFNNAIEVVIPSFTQSGSPSGSFSSALSFNDGILQTYVYGPPTIGTWLIPFSSFVNLGPGVFNWGAVNSGRFEYAVNGSFDGPIINEVQIDSIRAVPEPTQMVSVAAVGAVYGAWRLRKSRARRAGDAVGG